MTLSLKILSASCLATALGSLVSMPLTAQECLSTESWADCIAEQLNRFQDVQAQLQQEADTSNLEAVSDSEIQKLSQQVLIGAATASEGDLEDFLSSFLATLDVDGLESSDEGLRFKRNFQASYGTFALEAQARKSELFPELKMNLEETEQNDLIETLSGEIEDFDDLSVNIMFSADRSGENKDIWWGRRYRSEGGQKTGNAKVSEKLFAQITQPLKDARDSKAKAMDDALAELNKALGSISNKTVAETPQKTRDLIYTKIRQLAATERADLESFEHALREDHFFDFSKLVANQPQFIVSAGHSFRDELTGRDSWTASVKYEVGQANVNGFRRACPDYDLTCYHTFLDSQQNLLKKWRLAFEASYTWADEYTYTNTDGAVVLNLDESQEWDVSFSAGRSLRLNQEGMELTRFDLEADFQNPTGDTDKLSRLVATANITQKINETLSMAFGLIYANRPEFRGEVDEELSARAGLKIRLSQSNDL